jgi:Asp/Glu/hydantoin racemase
MFTELSKREMPDVQIFHMTDESLIKNTIRDGGLTKTTTRRVLSAVESAHEGGADAVVVTCSSIGEAASHARQIFDFPVIRIDDAMAERAVAAGDRIGVAATLQTTLEPTVGLIRQKARSAGREVTIVESLCARAFDAVLKGDNATHDRLLSDSLMRLVEEVDVVVLAQASMARVVRELPPEATRIPMLSSPELAVRSARAALNLAHGVTV